MNRNRLRIRTCCLAATIMLAGSGSMAVNAAPAAGLSDELLHLQKLFLTARKLMRIKKIQTILPRARVRRQKMRLRL